MKNEEISVITVCYNSEKTIEKTFQSLLNQTDKDFEYIVIDGASTDSTLSIIKKYKQIFGEKMTYISEKDNGLYDAMNKGIKMSHGKFIGIINSDDWYEKDAIETIKKEINKYNDIDIFYGYIRIIKDNKEYMIRRNNYDFIFEGNGLIQHPTCFLRKTLYDRYGMFDTKYKVCADQDLMLRMVSKGAKYKGIDKIISNFVVGGISFNYNSSFEINDIRCKYGIISKKQKRNFIIRHLRSYLKQKIDKYIEA